MICKSCKKGKHCKDVNSTSCFCQHRKDAQYQAETPLLPPKANSSK